MSFGGGFGGFGQNNQQQQSSGFGSSSFGGTNTGGFGSNTAAANPFGGNTANTGGSVFGNSSSGGFGSGGGFGSNNTTQTNSLFGGNKPAGFGTTTSSGGGIFGSNSNTATSGGFGGGGFGSTGTTGGFGSTSTSNNAFGATKPSGFGTTTTTTGTGGFGSGGGFGSTAATGTGTGFGSSTGTAFSGQIAASDGTAGTPFNPVSEKDPSSSTNNVYQSISYMQPYSRYSFEELRVADYQGGRRYANASGQPGAFGSSAFGSGFGAQPQQQNTGFGSGGGGFGATTSAPAFGGAQTQTTGGFGTGTTGTGSLFGAAKPATSLFGSTTNNAATTQSSLFGGNTATTGGFGQTPNAGSGFGGTGGSVFGNNQQAQPQQKSLFGGGGTTTSGFGTGGGFGTNAATTSTNPFGGTTTSAFGGNQQQQTGTSTSAFGGFGSQNQNQTKPGGLFGGAGTGTQQQQGGTGLFGGTNTGGSSLFGQNNQQQQQPQQAGTSLFGGQTQQTGTGVFGGAQQQEQKPGGLFGGLGTGTNTNTGSAFGGLGGAQNTQPAGTSLFGNTQAQSQQQKPGGLFGTGGGSLFGQSNTTQNAGSAFGAQPQQQQAGGFGTSSLFSSQQNQQQQPAQQQPAPGSFQASLLDGNPYGNQSIFSGLPAPNAPSPGPLATPLSASMKQKQRTPLPVYKITPNAANRLITPPRRQGYGFSYSTYGSPSSASSVSSLTGSLLGNGSVRGGNATGSLGRSFGKSFSTSNLRNSFDPDSESVLSPGAITGGQASRYSSGSLKRLTIDRSLKSELFNPNTAAPAPITNGEQTPQSTDKLKKRVSFDAPTDGALVRTETESPETTAEELGFIRSARKPEATNGTNGSAALRKPEMEMIRGNELAVVPEHTGLATNGTVTPVTSDPQPGQYWMKPSRLELSKMSREQLKHVENLTVGRQKCGQVTFGEPVDLTNIDLDSIIGDIVKITVRSITVYADDASKPPMGKGLNVPSTLRLENSWPRGRDKKVSSSINSGPFYEKHVQRLQKIKDTEFVAFERDTGVWVFRVPHFTTYGLDYDDEDDEGESFKQSTLSAGPDTPTPKARTPAQPSTENTFNSELNSTFSLDESFVGSMAGVDDDTFDFKKRKLVPGSFGDQMMQAEDEEVNSGEEESFLEDGSTGSVERDAEEDMTESIGSETESIEDEDMEMAGSFPIPHQTVEQDLTARTGFSALDVTSNSMRLGTPTKPSLDLSGNWAQQLQRTISPRKQDRETLRVKQSDAFVDKNRQTDNKQQAHASASASPSKPFTSSIDVMQSLFQQPSKNVKSPGKKQKGQLKAFELPHSKTPKTFASSSNELSASDDAFHQTYKPRWGPRDSLVEINDNPGDQSATSEFWLRTTSTTSFNGVNIRPFKGVPESVNVLESQRCQSSIQIVDGIPYARNEKTNFQSFIQSSTGASFEAGHERFIWQLTNILFNDEIEDDISAGVPPQLRKKFLHRIKKDRLSRLWESLVREKYGQELEGIVAPEERAVAFLAFHRVEDACKALVESGNLHLATMLAQIGRDKTSRLDMQRQVESWRQHNVFSEINEPIRALYELLAGNTLRSVGRPSGAPEDRASTFTFSERFDLDWMQAFGLRLWYGITEDQPIEASVSLFLHDIATGDEPAYPVPLHLEAEYAEKRQTTLTARQESPLWVLLKVYAAAAAGGTSVSNLSVNLPEAILPEAVSGSRLSSRLSFQLHQAITTTVGYNEHIIINKARADQLTWNYAWELIASGSMEPALFVLLHLSRATDREHAVKETLGQFAATLPRPTTDDGKIDAGWTYLVNDLRIPELWVWVAKALFARYSGDYANEVGYLIRARNWNEAHATFCRLVGPRTVIEHDWNILRQLLTGFGDSPDQKVRGWGSGGAVYEDFLRLVTAQGPRDQTVLKRLIGSLVIMGEKIKQTPGAEVLEERVAFMEMSKVVAGWCARDEQGVELSAILKLPLTGDARLMHTAEISRRYYGMVMASAH